ncbi:mating type protein A-alpha Z6 [Schizophyllum fasciatum]
MSLTEHDLRAFLASAESTFLSALSESDVAVAQFHARWDLVLARIQEDSTLQPSTYELLHSVGTAIKSLADTMVLQELDIDAIGKDLHARLSNNISRRVRLRRRTRKVQTSANSLPLPPYIEPCYKWLLANLQNPYPSHSIKQSLLDQARAQSSPNHEILLTPPPSPTSSRHSTPPRRAEASSATITLRDIEKWFAMARMRIGWGDVRRAKFDGDRALMLSAAHRMWAAHEDAPSNAFMSGCVSKRKPDLKREEYAPSSKTRYDFVAFRLPTPDLTTEDSSLYHDASTLAPDVELAFICIEAQAKAMYAHHLTPTELVDSLHASPNRRSDQNVSPSEGVLDPRHLASSAAYREALAKLALDKRRDARRRHRQARTAEAAMLRRKQERASYPSPEPSSGDESSTGSYSDASHFDSETSSSELDSDDEEDGTSEEDHSDAQNEDACPFAAYASTRTTFLTPAVECCSEDETEDEEQSQSDDSDETDDSDAESDDAQDSCDDALSEDEELTPPETLAGRKRRVDDEGDNNVESRPEKRQRYLFFRHDAIPVLTTPVQAYSCSAPESHSMCRCATALAGRCIQELLSPPSEPAIIGPNGVPLGTVRARLSKTQHRRPSPLLANRSAQPLSQRLGPRCVKITGDPTPWVNWNLDAASEGREATLRARDTTAAATSQTSIPRLPSVTSLSSMSSSSSSSTSSDASSLFSIDSTQTEATEPGDVSEPQWKCSASQSPASSIHPLFDPSIWSNYDLSAPTSGELRRSTGRGPSTFVPARLIVEAVDMTAMPAKHWTSPPRSPARLMQSTAPPVVSYQQAVGSITTPTRSSFGHGQLTAALPTGRKAGNTTRKIPAVRRRSSSSDSASTKDQEAAAPSSLVTSVLNSGLVSVSDLAPVTVQHGRRPSGNGTSPPVKTSTSSSAGCSAQAVRARLAAIEQEAARLEAERTALELLTSPGR